jgi:hypothetical protein
MLQAMFRQSSVGPRALKKAVGSAARIESSGGVSLLHPLPAASTHVIQREVKRFLIILANSSLALCLFLSMPACHET